MTVGVVIRGCRLARFGRVLVSPHARLSRGGGGAFRRAFPGRRTVLFARGRLAGALREVGGGEAEAEADAFAHTRFAIHRAPDAVDEEVGPGRKADPGLGGVTHLRQKAERPLRADGALLRGLLGAVGQRVVLDGDLAGRPPEALQIKPNRPAQDNVQDVVRAPSNQIGGPPRVIPDGKALVVAY
ncbi:unnamed protein product [Phytomonas sp. Hart1]|nr:unnamed protein product [Phytomonas sp. Hart1]|eukprot:CCW69955.1 unnamed protein product [Phytomonas sp. isolate Hart1]